MNFFYFSFSKSMDKYLKLFDVRGEATHFIGQIVLNLTVIERKRLAVRLIIVFNMPFFPINFQFY